MKNEKKKKVTKNKEKSKKKKTSFEKTSKEGSKWQEFLRRHSSAQQEDQK